MAEGLDGREVRAASEFVDGLHENPDLDHLARYVADGLIPLLRSDIATYNEVNPKLNGIRWVHAGVERMIPNAEDIFAAHMATHPFFGHLQRGDSAVLKVSDFLGMRAWRRHAMYTEFYRHHDIEHVMAVRFRASSGNLVLAALRAKHDFSERDRRLLGVVAPHCASAHRAASVAWSRSTDLALLRAGIDRLNGGAIQLAGDGRIEIVTERARYWLSRYFGWDAVQITRTRRLPESLAAWLAVDERRSAHELAPPLSSTPFIVEREGRRLIIHALARNGRRVLLMKECCVVLSADDLASLGLTRREAEILAVLARGWTDSRIAAALALSPKTVNHVVERIYRKLSVENRAAATAYAWRAAGDGGLQP